MTPYSTQIDDEEINHPEQKETLEDVATNIQIPGSEDENGVPVKRGRNGIFLIAAGGLIFFISVLIQLTAYIGWQESAAPVYAIITGLHIYFFGVFLFLDPKERASFDFMVNGNLITSSIPLRAIILASMNLIFSVVGIICMSTIGPSWYWPAWNIVGLTMSLLIAVVTVLHLSAGYLPSNYKNLTFPVSMNSLPNPHVLDNKFQDLVTSMAGTTISLFPEFSNINLAETIQVPKPLRRKALHHTTIALNMLLAAAMFSIQLLDITVSPKNEYKAPMSDPRCTYARNWLWFLDLAYSPSDAKLMVLISAPVTILLCLPLLFLTHRPSVVNLILASILSGAMAGFHCYQAVATMSWMIIMGSSVSPLTFSLRLGITLASPILASHLLSLSFSYLNTILLKEEHEDEPTSCCNKTSSVLVTLAAVLSISVTIAALIFTTGGLTVAMQGHWNSAQSGKYSDCEDSLSHRFEDNLRYFSWSQSGLSVTLLTLGFFLVLSGNKISRPILLLFGMMSFASTIATLILYFTGVFDYAYEMPSLLEFYVSNICQISLGFILGFGFSFAGGSFFVTLFSILLRTILAIVALTTLLVISLVVGIINLAKLSASSASKEKEDKLSASPASKEKEAKLSASSASKEKEVLEYNTLKEMNSITMCGGLTCSKNTLVVLNVVYIMASFLMIGVAIHGKTSGVITSLPIVGGITACGIFLLIISVVGLIAAVRHDQVMLSFCMVVLFMVFLIQFSVSCAALAINEEDERKIVEQSWVAAYNSNRNSSLILEAEQTFSCCGLKIDYGMLIMPVRCEEVPACKTNWNRCPPCMDRIKDKVDAGFNGAGLVGLFFSFTELIGGIVAWRYRNQLDPLAQTPSTPVGSS